MVPESLYGDQSRSTRRRRPGSALDSPAYPPDSPAVLPMYNPAGRIFHAVGCLADLAVQEAEPLVSMFKVEFLTTTMRQKLTVRRDFSR